MLELRIHDLGSDEASVRKTLHFAQQACRVVLLPSEEELEHGMELRVPARPCAPMKGESVVTLRGFFPTFLYASRLAHTVPGAADSFLHVVDRVHFARHSPLWAIEDFFASSPGPWLCSQWLKGSTAADFYLFCRLQIVNREHPEVFDDLPHLKRFLQSDPCFRHEDDGDDDADGDGDDDDDGDGDDDGGRGGQSGTGVPSSTCLAQ